MRSVRVDINDGKEWSAMDVDDLVNFAKLDESLEETATFLCRGDLREVARKAKELGCKLRPDDGQQWRRLL